MPKKVVIKNKEEEAIHEEMQPVSKAEDLKGIITYYKDQYDTAVGDRTTWQEKQNKWFKKRYGIRPTKTFPWPGASNLHMPLSDKTVRKNKANFVQIIHNAVPMVDMTPIMPDLPDRAAQNIEVLAENLEWHFDWLVRQRMKIFPEICIAADKTLTKGFSIAKTIYVKQYEPVTKVLMTSELQEWSNLLDLRDPKNIKEFNQILIDKFDFDITDENDQEKIKNIIQAVYDGAEAVEFTVQEVCKDSPMLSILDPEDVVVPSNTVAVFDLEDAAWIDHSYKVSPAKFLADTLNGKWKKEVAAEILPKHGIFDFEISEAYENKVTSENKDKNHDTAEKLREGINSNNDTIEIHEVYCWFDSDGDGIEERHVLNYCEEYMDDALRFIKYPYAMRKWPFVKIPYEITSYGHYSPRGVVEILSPIQASINMQHNAKINRQTLATAMMFWFVPGEVNQDNVRFIPGQGIPVKAPGNQNFGLINTYVGAEMSFEREEQVLKAWAEESLGTVDYGMASVINPTGTSNARTATEIQGIQQSAAPLRNMDLTIWKMAWAEIFDRISDLWIERGPEKFIAPVMGTKETREWLKADINYNSIIAPAGEMATTTPEIEQMKASLRYRDMRDNPYVKPYELTRQYLMADNPRKAKKLIMSPEEAAKSDQMREQLAMLQAQGQAQPGKKPKPKAKEKNANT